MNIIADITSKMKMTMDHLQSELRALRTGRANPSMLDGVTVEAYGSSMKLKELATISTPEPRMMVVTPFDPSLSSAIGKGIEKQNFRAIVEGHQVRVSIPPLNEEMRKELFKQAKKKAEDAKIAIREHRRKGNDLAKKLKNDGEMAEDAVKKTEKKIQELTDQFCREIDTLLTHKERDIMEI